MPTVTYVPSSTLTGSGVTLITDHLFSRKYELTEGSHSSLSTGATAGIAVGAAIGALSLFGVGIAFILRKRKARRVMQRDSQTEPPLPEEKPPGTPRSPNAHELPSPHSGSSPQSAKNQWRFFPSGEGTRTPPRQIVQELPGSIFINENHPAYRADSPSRATPDVEGSPNPSVIAPH
ncbi:MAG: hypothetical protein Q9160_003361 [Pyrenula sp. 1 TL-2023]